MWQPSLSKNSSWGHFLDPLLQANWGQEKVSIELNQPFKQQTFWTPRKRLHTPDYKNALLNLQTTDRHAISARAKWSP